jgi:hypothetical protein
VTRPETPIRAPIVQDAAGDASAAKTPYHRWRQRRPKVAFLGAAQDRAEKVFMGLLDR